MMPDPTLAYRQSASQSASPLRVVILLYEQLVKDIQRAMAAMVHDDIETRANEIDHALVVVGKLQSTLDMEHGGEVARNLERFYQTLRGSLIEAQARLSPELLRAQVAHLLTLREAWIEVEQASLTRNREPQSGAPQPASGHGWEV